MVSILRKGNFSVTPVESSDSQLEEFSVASSELNLGQVKVIERDLENRRVKCELVIPESSKSKPAAIALAWIALEYFFEQIRVVKVCVDLLSTDLAGLEFHRLLGFCEEGRLSRHQVVGDRVCDLVLMAHFRETWDKKKKYLESLLEEKEAIS